MRCPKCGNNLNDNDRVCDFCGYLIIQEQHKDVSDNVSFYKNDNVEKEEKPKKKVNVAKIIFVIAILACLVYVALVGIKWFNNKDNNKKNDDVPVQTNNTNTDVNKNENKNNDKNNEVQNATETIIENNGFRYVIPAYYNVYKNTEAYVELINNNDKVNIVMYKLLDMEYDLLKAAPEAYIASLQEKNMTLIKNLEKFYNSNRYYVIYCKSGNNNFYQIFTSFYGKTISFGITDFGSNEEDDLFDVIDMIINDATAIS